MKGALEVGFSLVCAYPWHIGNTFGPKGRIAPLLFVALE